MLKFKNNSNPTIFWILGSSSTVGKTTVSTALIRYLNTIGYPALGFKPLAGAKLRDIIDFAALNYSRLPNSVFGSDGLELSRASPLTIESEVDLVSPWQLIFYQNILDTVIIRTGSISLENIMYYKSSFSDIIKNRSDIINVNQILRIPFNDAVLFDDKESSRSSLASHVRESAFSALLKKNPTAVVVESAGPFVPSWKGSPQPNHIIFIDDFSIKAYFNINEVGIDMENFSHSELLETELKNRKLPKRQINQFYTESKHRSVIMEKLISVLLSNLHI
jgi:hypothetical protein